MKRPMILSMFLIALAGTAFAGGDAAKGENDFKKCRACHAIIAPDGTEIQKGGRTGPNLFGLIGSVVGHDTGFRYGPATLAAHDLGIVWDEEKLVAYLADPSKWLAEQTGDPAARSRMAFKLPKGGADIAAYLASLATAEPADAAEAGTSPLSDDQG